MTDTIDKLYEELDSLYGDSVNLCEVRGELDPESNAQIEARIAAINTRIATINAELKELKSLGSRWG